MLPLYIMSEFSLWIIQTRSCTVSWTNRYDQLVSVSVMALLNASNLRTSAYVRSQDLLSDVPCWQKLPMSLCTHLECSDGAELQGWKRGNVLSRNKRYIASCLIQSSLILHSHI